MSGKLVKLREFIRCNTVAAFPKRLNKLGAAPIFADLKPTDRCSSRCQTCKVWNAGASAELTTSDWRVAIKALKVAGILDLFFTGGDIFLRGDIFDLLEFSASQGLRVHCVTNGYALNGELARDLMQLKPASISLSLDALGVELDAIRGTSGAAQKVMQAVGRLKAHSNGSTRISLAATLMKNTIASVGEVTEWAMVENLPIMYNLIHFTHYYTDTRFSREQYDLNEQDWRQLRSFLLRVSDLRRQHPDLLPPEHHLDFIRSYFKDYHQRSLPCFKPLLDICIDPNGDIRPCCSMEPVGHILVDDLQALKKSSKYIQVAARGLEKSCPGCSCHYNLSLDMNLRVRVHSLYRWLCTTVGKPPFANY